MTSNQSLSLSLKPMDKLEDDGNNGGPSLPSKKTVVKETPSCGFLSTGVMSHHPPKRGVIFLWRITFIMLKDVSL